MNSTNTPAIVGSVTRHAITGAGISGLVASSDDVIKLVSLLLTALGLGWSIWEKMTRKGGGPAARLFLAGGLVAAMGLLAGCGTLFSSRTLDPAGPYHGDTILSGADDLIIKTREAYGSVLNLAARNPGVVTNSAAISNVVHRIGLELDGQFEPDELLGNLVKARDAYAAAPVATNATALQATMSLGNLFLTQARDLIPALLPPATGPPAE